MIVGVELVRRDRDSFDEWWPRHLREIMDLVDWLMLRIDNETWDGVVRLIPNELESRIEVRPQFSEYGRFQEDAERQELLRWAKKMSADWVACFDADEVIEPGGGEALRSFLQSPMANATRLVQVILSYSSHHRPGYVLPRGEIRPWRVFRLDRRTENYVYKSDADGLHCGSVPSPGVGSRCIPDLRVIHYHATTCAEYMEERRFYDETIEVHRHGGIDYLYRCDRFGDEALAIPLEQELSGSSERLARVAAGEGLMR